VELDSELVDILSPIDQLLHVCIHASYQHWFSCWLRPATDVRLLLAESDSWDWEEVIQRSQQRNWHRGVALTLAMAKSSVGADVPDEVIRRLADVEGVQQMATTLGWSVPKELADPQVVVADLRSISLEARLDALNRRALLSRVQLTARYGIAQNIWWWRLLHVRRIAGLIRRYVLWAVRSLAVPAAPIRPLSRNRSAVARWLNSE
jgi:hypothetical protein